MRTWIGNPSHELVTAKTRENGSVASTVDRVRALHVKLVAQAKNSGDRTKV
jgi:hypothetical protein